MKIWIFAIAILSVLPDRMNAQEDSIRLNKDSLRINIQGEFYSSDFLLPRSSDFKGVEFESLSLPPKPESIDMKLCSPSSIPPYYTNPSPMFYGDYSTSGKVLPYVYGSGSQYTLPGIGRMNNASLLFQYDLNQYVTFSGGMNVTKYNFAFNTGQVFNSYGTMTYRPNERLRISAFGSYAPANPYGFFNTSYGATVGYDFSDRFGMEVGVQRHYDPMRRKWETIPIVVPYYKFDKFELGMDVGGIVYEILRNVIENNRQSGSPVMIPFRR